MGTMYAIALITSIIGSATLFWLGHAWWAVLAMTPIFLAILVCLLVVVIAVAEYEDHEMDGFGDGYRN